MRPCRVLVLRLLCCRSDVLDVKEERSRYEYLVAQTILETTRALRDIDEVRTDQVYSDVVRYAMVRIVPRTMISRPVAS